MDRNLQYANIFSKMIQCQTISQADGKSTEMARFHETMNTLFPNILKAAELETLFGCVILKWHGKDPSHRVLLMNHHDVVPAEGNWTHSPFAGEIADGKLWGRGTLDTKGGLFGMMQAADELAASGFVPNIDIWFESSCCEEITPGDLGSDLVSQKWAEEGIRFDWVLDEGGMILYEPVAGAKGHFAMIGVGEKGSTDLKFTAHSHGGHGSTPPKNTPLVRLGKFMSEFDRHDPFKVQLTDVTFAMFRCLSKKMSGPLKFVMGHPRFFAPVLKAVMTKNPTSNATLRTTMAFTCAQGSEAKNVIPQQAWVIGNMRFSHHEGQAHSVQAVFDLAKKYDLEPEVLQPGYESGISPIDSKAFNLIENAVSASYSDVITTPYVQTGASDSRFMNRVSDNIYRFVPFAITNDQLRTIHGIDENVDVKTLGPAVDFYKYLLQNA